MFVFVAAFVVSGVAFTVDAAAETVAVIGWLLHGWGCGSFVGV